MPVEAVIRDGDVADGLGAARAAVFKRRKVKLGIERDGLIRSDGLQAGEQVVGRGAIFVDNEWRQ